jgi:trk system potassium uptake protein TrkH
MITGAVIFFQIGRKNASLFPVQAFKHPYDSFKQSMMPHLRHTQLNPARLFIFSFLGLVFIGTLMLKLPHSTRDGISFIDALFTSTSAVCITGLTVMNTSSDFTIFGQTVIMLLIQSGALGILTFASYFSYFFKGGSSYETQIVMSSISNTEKIGDVFKTLKRILIITISIELIGAAFIYGSLNPALIPSIPDRIFFSAFHAVSAFCNAGFSTLQNGIMETGYVTNYPFQLSLIFLFFLGGLGFPIVINIIKYLKHRLKTIFLRFTYGRKDGHKPWIMTLGSRINLMTTFSLIIIGFTLIFLGEYDNVLTPHQGIGKFVTALFTSTVSRTAGFNTIDYNQLHIHSIMLIMFLMWIGGSPVSTAGGIKTSTFAIAVLNFANLARNKSKIEIYNREIANISIRRAFATIMLSLLAIGMGVTLISIFDKNIPILQIVFECVSAYGTVGLSLGITTKLSIASKVVICVLMFVGRITFLTVLIALFKRVKYTSYAYPSEEILIN